MVATTDQGGASAMGQGLDQPLGASAAATRIEDNGRLADQAPGDPVLSRACPHNIYSERLYAALQGTPVALKRCACGHGALAHGPMGCEGVYTAFDYDYGQPGPCYCHAVPA